jgi:hypothetical protein
VKRNRDAKPRRSAIPIVFDIRLLDLLACSMGALTLLMLLFGLRVATQSIEGDSIGASDAMAEARRILHDAERWALERKSVEARVREMEGELERTEAERAELRERWRLIESAGTIAAPSDPIAAIARARERRAEAERRLHRVTVAARLSDFDAVNPRAPAEQRPRIVYVEAGRALDLETREIFEPKSKAWRDFAEGMRDRKEEEYVLFLVARSGVPAALSFEQEFRNRRLMVGRDPYSEHWAPAFEYYGLTPPAGARP